MNTKIPINKSHSFSLFFFDVPILQGLYYVDEFFDFF